MPKLIAPPKPFFLLSNILKFLYFCSKSFATLKVSSLLKSLMIKTSYLNL